ncbi:MAG: monooxygenase [Parcubacteria group bacterium]|nr:monooxygenase [Parcubacteria group bacterium]
MSHRQVTAPERVKMLGPAGLQFLDLGELRGFMEAKGFDLKLVSRLAERSSFGRLFGELVLRRDTLDAELLDQYGQALGIINPAESVAYTGTDLQNSRIDVALANSGITLLNKRYGEGSATFFKSTATVPQALRSVPIAIIGHGAAGIMAAHALRALGFNRITIYEKAKTLGIWGQENVYQLSRNNPVQLEFFGKILEAAPGTGKEVRTFLQSLISGTIETVKVESVEPGNLRHRIKFASGSSAEYPIVINAAGLGKPKPVSDPTRMTTTTGLRLAGMRWQQQLELERVIGQRLILIGLGNSTAEMLQQIHIIIDDGYDIDYRILTHYPEDAVENPTAYVPHRNRMYRVFRDTSRPNLVDYQGDLAHSRYDYTRALHGDKIVSDVTRWEVKTPGVMTVFDGAGKPSEDILYDKVMTLIGYRQPEETMLELGCHYDNQNQCGVFDYDGEVATRPGHLNAAKRLHKGYFGFGSILETPLNPNAIVIPGMLHRIGDLMFGVIMRAAEVRKKEFLRG